MQCLQGRRNNIDFISMPYVIRKKRNRNCYTVKSKRRVHSKCTTLKKARIQVNLLNRLERDHRVENGFL
jgi:hypothetical protein